MRKKGKESSLIPVNSTLNNSLAGTLATLNNIAFSHPNVPAFVQMEANIRAALYPISILSQSFAKTYKIAEIQAWGFKQGEIISQLSRLQKIPFSKIAETLNTSLEALRFREFDLQELYEEESEFSQELIITETIQIRKLIRQIYLDNQFLFQLASRKFEEVIAELFDNKGFDVELTKQTRDNGYDILALKRIGGLPVKFLVECKKYAPNRPIGIDFIRSFCDVIEQEKANKGIIVTTSYFSPESKERQEKEGHILDLKDKTDIILWMEEYLGIK